MKQEEINRLLVDKSLEYEKVVRLKGGDPYVFGRGGEEALALMEHGVHFEIVPGISSALAGPAYAGIPVTHRGLSSGFHVVTAHNRRDGSGSYFLCFYAKSENGGIKSCRYCKRGRNGITGISCINRGW